MSGYSQFLINLKQSVRWVPILETVWWWRSIKQSQILYYCYQKSIAIH